MQGLKTRLIKLERKHTRRRVYFFAPAGAFDNDKDQWYEAPDIKLDKQPDMKENDIAFIYKLPKEKTGLIYDNNSYL